MFVFGPGTRSLSATSMTEMAEWARRNAGSADITVFADGDTGHGNVTNVARTMQEFERAGVAADSFEDQVSPKRCGRMSGKHVIPVNEMIWKLHSAIDAAIERALRYVEAGADMVFIESPESVEQMRRITREVRVPQLANMLPGGRSHSLTAVELRQIGFAAVAYPTSLTYAIAAVAQELLRKLKLTGNP